MSDASVDTATQPPLSTRGDETRAQLLDAGMTLFAERGFDAVGTRELARAAGVNLAAIAYHFGSKHGLYMAITESIVADVGDAMLHHVRGLADGIARAGNDRRALGRLAAGLVRRLITVFVADPARKRQMAFVLHEYTRPGEAFDRIFETVVEPMHRTLTALVAAARGLPAEHPDAIIGAHAVIGQVMAFAIADVPVRRRLGWDAVTPDRRDAIGAVVVPMVLASLNLLPDEST